jgi:tetratricopeptide (TPR) repeat protein
MINLKEDIDYYMNLIEKQEAIGDIQGKSDLLFLIGNILQKNGHPNDAIEFYSKSLDLEQALGNISKQGIINYNIAGIYKDLGNIEQAVTLTA